MAYVPLNPLTPEPAQDGTEVLQSIRDNLKAIRDGIVLGGLPGFNCAASGGTEDARTDYLYTGTGANSAERIKVAVTYGVSGGAIGNPVTLVFTYSSNSGTSYEAIGTMSVSYTPNGYFSSYTW